MNKEAGTAGVTSPAKNATLHGRANKTYLFHQNSSTSFATY
jgi:hypothetical protein